MKRRQKKLTLALTALVLTLFPGGSHGSGPQVNGEITRMMIQSYDLLEAGKADEARKIYQQVLQKDPGNPLALNNLGAVMVKKGNYKEALASLEQALVRAKGYKVMVNKVCEVKGICLAFRPLGEVYGNQELEPLIRLNIRMVKTKLTVIE
jgi:tetratricopeptide (TPR) repeat protein